MSLFVIWLIYSANLVLAEDQVPTASTPATRTIVADILMVDGDFYIVRGERGEIQIEVTPDTKLFEEFKFGDRIKAVLLPNDRAVSIARAGRDEPVGMTKHNDPTPPPPAPKPEKPPTVSSETVPPTPRIPANRVIIADLLMVDGDFYIVRGEHGEIQIEITPDTKLSEQFQFGDRIKARVTPSDKALSVVRAGKHEEPGIQEDAPPHPTNAPSSPTTREPLDSEKLPVPEEPEQPQVKTPTKRVIVADVLMVDGDFYIVRGERGEIQIEVTPKTVVSEAFDYGDRIKATVLPNDKALTIERAAPDDPIGITTP